VRIPATTANMGPGFDSLGMALSLWNYLRVSWSDRLKITLHGEGADRLRKDKTNLIYRAVARLLEEAGTADRDVHIESWQNVPLSRGLGSSSCAIAGGLFAANALLGYAVTPHRLLELATEMEGHPDNVAPALMGNMSIAVSEGGTVHAAPIPVPKDLQCVVFIPDRPLTTKKARSVLGPQVSRADAVYNIGRAALLVASFALDRPEYLGVATQDRLHQPARQKVYREMKVIFLHAMAAGARGVFLSGAGSAVIALTTKSENRAFTIGYEMADAGDKANLPGTFRVLEPATAGVEVIDALPEEEL
ncbi:MAG: homoserine kinase, partial [Dehalococcoidia bacterium]